MYQTNVETFSSMHKFGLFRMPKYFACKFLQFIHVMSVFEFRALIPKSTREGGFMNGNNKNYDVLIIEVRTNQNEDAKFVFKLT